MIFLGTYFLGSTYLGFSQLLISIGLGLLPSLKSFSYYIFKNSSSSICSPFLLESLHMNVGSFAVMPQDPASVHFCQSIFFLFRFDQFYYSVFKFTNAPPVIYSLLLNLFGEFSISHTIFLYRFHYSLFYNLYFFDNIFYFFVSR